MRMRAYSLKRWSRSCTCKFSGYDTSVLLVPFLPEFATAGSERKNEHPGVRKNCLIALRFARWFEERQRRNPRLLGMKNRTVSLPKCARSLSRNSPCELRRVISESCCIRICGCRCTGPVFGMVMDDNLSRTFCCFIAAV